MGSPKGYRKLINKIRKYKSKKNGSLGWIDDPFLDKLLYNSKHKRNLEHKIGEYFVDYDELTEEELQITDSAVDDLIQRSRIISKKEGL